MHSVLRAHYVRDYILRVTFEDGSVKLVDLDGHLKGEVMEPLQNLRYFSDFRVDLDTDTLVWGNGADISPDFLYEIGDSLV